MTRRMSVAVALLFALVAGTAWSFSPDPQNAVKPSPSPSGDVQALALEKARLEVENARTLVKKAEADLAKAEADTAKAKADAKRAEAEAARPTVEYLKADYDQTRYYWDLAYKVLLLLAGMGLVLWALPRVQEITLPILGGNVVAKLGDKLPPAPPPSVPPPPAAPGPTAGALREAAAVKKQSVPASILNRAEEDDVYAAVGVARHALYVAHRAHRIPKSENRRLVLYLDADEPAILDKVDRVTYRLHPTFNPSEITSNDRAKAFTMELNAWGEFMLYALVYFKGQDRPVQLARYLNF